MWIQNVSFAAVEKGLHYDPGCNSMLIQIVDPALGFPTPKHEFKEIHQFEFLDIEENDPEYESFKEFEISNDQATQLVSLLQHALDNCMNVIVHCVAGQCRSGAVVEVGTMMGFQDTGTYRHPNIMVKQKMMKVLGWMY